MYRLPCRLYPYPFLVSTASGGKQRKENEYEIYSLFYVPERRSPELRFQKFCAPLGSLSIPSFVFKQPDRTTQQHSNTVRTEPVRPGRGVHQTKTSRPVVGLHIHIWRSRKEPGSREGRAGIYVLWESEGYGLSVGCVRKWLIVPPKVGMPLEIAGDWPREQ